MSETVKKKRTGPLTFFKQVRDEGRKVTWATKNETMAATIMVLLMVVVAALFFYLVDAIIRVLIGIIL